MSDERDVQQVMARYTRAADGRDAAAMSALFMPDARVEVFLSQDGTLEQMGQIDGAETIGHAVAGLMLPHPPRGWSHHTTFDSIIEVNGDVATLDAQFIVYNTVGDEKPAAGWPAGAFGAQGTIRPIEAGYYRPSLRRVDGAWKIEHLNIVHDLPYAFPGA